MELRHLRYFVAIGEEENYRRAAGRLNVAQTALSTQIQDLEAELGFKLFDRLPRGVKLSVAGKLFLDDARRILAQVNEAAARAAASPAANRARCVSVLLKMLRGTALCRIPCGSSGNGTPTPSCSSFPPAAWIKSRISDRAVLMPVLSSPCRRTTTN